MRVTANGQKSFHFYRKFQGSPVRIHVGDFPETSVENARKACQIHSADIANGIDPRAKLRAVRREQTFKSLWAYWLEDAKRRGVKTVSEDERRYQRFLVQWASRRLSAIHKTEVQALFAKVTTENSRYAANRMLALLKSMFHKAPDMGFTGTDPTAGVKKHQEEKRDRFIRGDELEKFFRALLAEKNVTLRDLLLIALLTGARKGNVQAMA